MALWAYRWLLKQGDIEAAGTFLACILTADGGVPEDIHSRGLCEAAYLAARFGGTPDTARLFLREATCLGMADKSAARRAETAVCLAEGEGETCEHRSRLRLRIVQRGLASGKSLGEEDWFTRLEAALSLASPSGTRDAQPL
jgi:hypothetical protein